MMNKGHSDRLNDYSLGSVIGRGSYALVRLCRLKDRKLAAKIYSKNILNADKRLNLER
jgi:hypothetical protein